MIPYTLARSKRKTIAVYIKNGAVSVRAPYRVSDKAVADFVASKTDWIERKLRESARRNEKFRDVFELRRLPYLGGQMRIAPCERKTFAFSDGVLSSPVAYCADGNLRNEPQVRAALARLYKRLSKAYLGERLQALSAATGMRFSSFALTNAKGKWGSCDTKDRIRLNWHLLLLPKGLIDYVLLHELSHTVQHNHSRRFWECVRRWYPRYKEAVACLKETGVLIDWLC